MVCHPLNIEENICESIYVFIFQSRFFYYQNEFYLKFWWFIFDFLFILGNLDELKKTPFLCLLNLVFEFFTIQIGAANMLTDTYKSPAHVTHKTTKRTATINRPEVRFGKHNNETLPPEGVCTKNISN